MSVIATLRIELDRSGREHYSVEHDWPMQNEPVILTRTWPVSRMISDGYGRGPTDGDILHYRTVGGSWIGPGYEAWVEGDAKMTEKPAPPLAKKIVRGRPTRWQDGRWQVLTAKGWQ